ncbi:MAG: LysR family transcriptional regulator, partial [Myxococcales bacterium]|nr:LysR family transcriptional regulator [Myxococcales bacterium]
MNLNHLAVFIAVAETRSFTKAAERLKLDKGHVSRVLRSLEEACETRLVERTTRSVELTPAGLELVANAAAPLAALERAGRSLRDRPATPAGLVTLTTTPDIGRMLVAPSLGAFRSRYPAVRVKLVLDQRMVSLSQGAIDLALRVGKIGPAQARAKKLGELAAGFFAAPR